MKQWLEESKLSQPKCAVYILVGYFTSVISSADAPWEAHVLAALVAWKAFMSDSTKKPV